MTDEQLEFCLLGKVFVDFHLRSNSELVLGGIFHAARALRALDVPVRLAFIAPEYLERQIRERAHFHGIEHVAEIGRITGSPNVILIGESKEIGDQGYEDLLSNDRDTAFSESELASLLSENVTDTLIFDGGFELGKVLQALSAHDVRVHLDAIAGPISPEEISKLTRKLDTLILSTSSDPFLDDHRGSIESVLEAYSDSASTVLLKENRGGSRYFEGSPLGTTRTQGKSYPRRIVHSVGVGDCFNGTFLALKKRQDLKSALNYSALIAAEYACSFDQSSLKQKVDSLLAIPPNEVNSMVGISLPWENRPGVQIYLAAPDFKSNNRPNINGVIESLRYHNFQPRLPVREHGEISETTSALVRKTTAKRDLELLESCQICLVVLDYNDPGTLIEIGYAHRSDIPIVVYDPYEIASNLILEETPSLISADLDVVLTEVFRISSTLDQ